VKRKAQDDNNKHIQIIAGLKRDLERAHMELERAGEIEVHDSERYLDLLTDTPAHPRASVPPSAGALAASRSVHPGSKYREEGLLGDLSAEPVEEDDPWVMATKTRERQAERKKRLEENLERYEVESQANRIPASSAPTDILEGPTPPSKGGINSDSEVDARRPKRLSRRAFGFGSSRRLGTRRYESKSDTDISSAGPRSADRPFVSYTSEKDGRSSSADYSVPSPVGVPGGKPGDRAQYGAGDEGRGMGSGMGFAPPKRERKLSAGGMAAAIVKGWKSL
jgi:hypothetical protein